MKLLLALAALALLCGVAALLAFRFRPLAMLRLLGRSALRSAKLEKATLAGSRGEIVVFRGGSGPTLVLLHGVNDQAGGWARLAKPLAAKYRLIVPDLPGHGESAPAGGPLTVDDLLAGVDAVLASEPRPAILVGNSMGGWLALLTARRHPEQVARVVLINGSAIKADSGFTLVPKDRAEARQAMDAILAPSAPRTPDYVLDDLVRLAPTSPMARLLTTPFDDHALDGKLGEVTVPVTLLWGASDRLLPRAYAEKIAAGLPQAKLTLIEDCGHMPQRECPDRLLPLLEQALAGR